MVVVIGFCTKKNINMKQYGGSFKILPYDTLSGIDTVVVTMQLFPAQLTMEYTMTLKVIEKSGTPGFGLWIAWSDDTTLGWSSYTEIDSVGITDSTTLFKSDTLASWTFCRILIAGFEDDADTAFVEGTAFFNRKF